MSQPLSPELEAQAQELAARIRTRSADAILDMARQLVTTPDEKLFGKTELQLRDRLLPILGHALEERLEKKVVTSVLVSIAPTANAPSASTTTAPKRSGASAGASVAIGLTTTTAARAGRDRARGTIAWA